MLCSFEEGWGLFGECHGGSIRNLKLDKSWLCVSGPGTALGGIVGRMTEGQIENCESAAHFSAMEGSCGGILGEAVESEKTMLRDCRFDGIITAQENSLTTLGGIAGSGGIIENCVGSGLIRNGNVSGGIVGEAHKVIDCQSLGEVNGERSGGIAGSLYERAGGGKLSYRNRYIRKCVNQGEVTGGTHVGGIVGWMSSENSAVSMDVSQCSNEASVEGITSAGGIVGRMDAGRGKQIVGRNKNTGPVLGHSDSGGIMGMYMAFGSAGKGNAAILQCENEGEITGDGDNAGGILSTLTLGDSRTGTAFLMEHCKNTGSISAAHNGGGILGLASGASAMLQGESPSEPSFIFHDCCNTGDVEIGNYSCTLGGIAGNWSIPYVDTLFESCVNTGSLTVNYQMKPETLKEMEKTSLPTYYQVAGGIIGQLGELPLAESGADAGKKENINSPDGYLVLEDCYSTGPINCPDYEKYRDASGDPVFVNYLGALVGSASRADGFRFTVKDCSFAQSGRGLGDKTGPDFGTRVNPEQITGKLT